MRSPPHSVPAMHEGIVSSERLAGRWPSCFSEDEEPVKGHLPRSPKAERIAQLRRIVANIETSALGGNPAYLPLGRQDLSRQDLSRQDLGRQDLGMQDLGMQEVHRSLPGPGLACGVLHEVGAAAHGDRPAALGFLFALLVCAQHARPGPAVFVASRRGLADFGDPYGHGLRQLGLDVGRFLLIETRNAKEALWALEEVLRSEAVLAMVAGAVECALDLTASRRLNLAAAARGTPLLVLRGAQAAGSSAASTRWRIANAPAARDAFGTFKRCRWSVELERCRNGRPGQWMFEWNHVAHCFHLVEGMADHAFPARADLRRAS
jgi:protein ImuA